MLAAFLQAIILAVKPPPTAPLAITQTVAAALLPTLAFLMILPPPTAPLAIAQTCAAAVLVVTIAPLAFLAIAQTR